MTMLPVEDLVFVDEAGVNLGMTRRFGRTLSGQRAYGTRPQQRGRNVSVIGAIALRGVVASIAIVGATDGLTFLELAGATLHFLSSYSPDFSPIENCWSKVKEFIRSIAPRTYDLAQAINRAFQQVSLQDIHHWFTHCCYCITEYVEPVSSLPSNS
ncbi:transposase [Nostoc flagelliforme]|nr:transposase [Nostoc flagelliforme]